MTPSETLDVSALKPYQISNRAMLFWGQVLMCAIEGTLLLILAAMYFYYRLSVDVWPPPGVKPLGVALPTLALIPLFFSTLGSYWASESAKTNSLTGMIVGLSANFVLGVVFLVMRGFEWSSFSFLWTAGVFGSIVWAILFIHTLDTGADLLMTLVLILILAAGRNGERQRLGVHVDSVIWYFLAGIWIPLYAVIYWGPKFVGNGG